MARRKNTDAADGLIHLISLLPWWGGVAAALVGYLVLHRLALQPAAPMTDPAQLGAAITRSFWHAAALVGQYVVPMVCLAGAAVSAIQRRQRTALVKDVVQSKAADALDGMSWQDFEKLVGEGFRLQGYRVAETGGGGADGGIDLVLTKASTNGAEKFLVQCKQWRAFKVGVDIVRELYGVMAAKGAAGGFVVTSGRFTVEAIRFADGRNIKLVDGPKLFGLLRQAEASSRGTRPIG